MAAFPGISGNAVNGLGEEETRRASPFFWHPPERQTHGDLQQVVFQYFMNQPVVWAAYSPIADNGPERGPDPVPVAPKKVTRTAESWTDYIKQFALENEADDVAVAAMDENYVYDGYEIAEPFIIIIAVAHDYDQIRTAPEPAAGAEVAVQYHRAARAAKHIGNEIRNQGYEARVFDGPLADALLMIPAAIDSGLGELGKHGSIIHKKMGSSFRLSAVTTDMPLVTGNPDTFGVDDFCSKCRVCENNCPPGAITSDKQLVRGVEKWYVDFDKCIPYFAETTGCAACIATCPWSRPGVADNILLKMERRKNKVSTGNLSF